MVTTHSKSKRDNYMELVAAFPLRPIRNRDAHACALSVLQSLFGKQPAAVRDYKIVLISLIADYERSAGLTVNTDHITAADVVRHALGERGMSVNALAKSINVSQSSVSDMLNGRRAWSKSAIVGVCDFFGLNPRLFLQRPAVKPTGTRKKSA